MHPQLHGIIDGLAILTLAFGAHYRLRYHPAYSISLLLDGLVSAIWAGVVIAWLPNLRFPLRALFTNEILPSDWWRSGLDNWLLGIAGAAFAGYFFLRHRNLPVWLVLDAFAPLLAITLAIWRVGCAINADSYGKVTDSWIAMWLPDVTGNYAWRYPTQYVSIGMNLLIASVLLWWEHIASRRWHRLRGMIFRGFSFWMYVLLYCSQRFFFEFWRGDREPIFGTLTVIHLYCIFGLTCAAIGMWSCKNSQKSVLRTID